VTRALPFVIVALAVADGLIHLALVVAFSRTINLANFQQSRFVLNFLAYVLLAGAFLVVRRRSLNARRVVDALLALLTLATLVAWLLNGRFPNPSGLGYTSKLIEIVLIVAVALHAASLGRKASPATGPSQ
jgi:Na+-translocating ferredoxin:NAD+ oxidoreductase RnfA subunit